MNEEALARDHVPAVVAGRELDFHRARFVVEQRHRGAHFRVDFDRFGGRRFAVLVDQAGPHSRDREGVGAGRLFEEDGAAGGAGRAAEGAGAAARDPEPGERGAGRVARHEDEGALGWVEAPARRRDQAFHRHRLA